MEFWATLIGAAVGVVAGAFIQYIADYIVRRQTEKQQRRALKKEMQYNLQVLNGLAAECTNLRNALNGDTLDTYFGYLNYGEAFFFQATALLNNGALYQWFDIDTLKKLQKVSTTLNPNNANWVNNNITQRRDAVKAGTYVKSEAVQFVNFVEAQINTTRTLLNEFIAVI